jgi:hypothetical protein
VLGDGKEEMLARRCAGHRRRYTALGHSYKTNTTVATCLLLNVPPRFMNDAPPSGARTNHI